MSSKMDMVAVDPRVVSWAPRGPKDPPCSLGSTVVIFSLPLGVDGVGSPVEVLGTIDGG
jgi:hypothetical protein